MVKCDPNVDKAVICLFLKRLGETRDAIVRTGGHLKTCVDEAEDE